RWYFVTDWFPVELTGNQSFTNNQQPAARCLPFRTVSSPSAEIIRAGAGLHLTAHRRRRLCRHLLRRELVPLVPRDLNVRVTDVTDGARRGAARTDRAGSLLGFRGDVRLVRRVLLRRACAPLQ